MFKVISQDTLLDKRRSMTIEEDIPFEVNGKTDYAKKKLVNGEMETLSLNKPLGEMMSFGSTANLKDLLRKVTLDVELGREAVQLVYNPIYDTISDPNLPQTLDAKWALYGNCVFLEHIEGQEIKFGSLSAEHGPVARIQTYATGFEYTKEMIDFNQTFNVEMLNKSMGEAYNALLNHMHLYPIIGANYKASNKTAFQGKTDDPLWLGIWRTLNQAIKDTVIAKRPGTILLASKADQTDIEMAIRGGHQLEGSIYPSIAGISTIIYYDGWSVQVGKKSYEYKGVTPGTAFLIRPQRGFKELVKKDMTPETGNPDLTRLVEAQIVGYCYRGVFAAIDENVQQIALK
ncbi:MAG: aspartate ammonia-lyase [Clostridium tyrobutyricum]|jgi:hypothetical protein|uniref:phage major capsid protein n=1 Tax=Clostridium tyrobutyricum TaxID=1519 RepID=UPI00242A6A11|nr:hypothetical protein [Clostridium tyrobutyricum]MCH4199269.1 aspartate ammonia-lyase [Clostridium tyrobutyricum]MCH4236601.1 aspartate ammonia-lyase [Clostridium tyrobutyricum]MCH4258083.1 aspartate ammonia-lyase [Clostridium tyrobutyricum]MCI1239122.1 aspartate ammonia-lyase [Clostridium tyrobutyricum]MCI1651406.1 aspartate ammonia-lyase [Clostridium tyrobutyricum]